MFKVLSTFFCAMRSVKSNLLPNVEGIVTYRRRSTVDGGLLSLWPWLTRGKWMCPDRFLITGAGTEVSLLCPISVMTPTSDDGWRPGDLSGAARLLSHYSVPSLSQACQSELPNTPHTNYGLCFHPSGASISPLWPLCILLSVPGHWWWSMFLMLKAGQIVYKIYENK